MNQKYPPKAWLLLILLSLIWGSSFILIKKGLLALTPLEVGSLRMFSAGICLLPVAVYRLHNIEKMKIKYLISVGLAGSFIPSFLFAIAQTRIESSVTGILNALTPLFTVLVGSILFSQKQGSRVYVGVFIGLVGTILLITAGAGDQLGQFNYYALLIVMATVLYALNSNLIKFKLQDLKSITITSVSLLIVAPFAGGILFFFTDFFFRFGDSQEMWIATGYIVLLGVMGTAIALIIFNKLVQLTDPVFTSSVTYIIPVIAVCWGLLDGEILVLADLFGMVCILIGIYVTNRSTKVKTTKI